MHVFPREAPHWGPGDLAYCVSAHVPPECTARLEKGRVYRVTRAVKPSNIAHHALRLDGFEWSGPGDFVWSNRFVRLGPVGGRLAAIDQAIEYGMRHYWPNCFPVPPRWTKRRAPTHSENNQ